MNPELFEPLHATVQNVLARNLARALGDPALDPENVAAAIVAHAQYLAAAERVAAVGMLPIPAAVEPAVAGAARTLLEMGVALLRMRPAPDGEATMEGLVRLLAVGAFARGVVTEAAEQARITGGVERQELATYWSELLYASASPDEFTRAVLDEARGYFRRLGLDAGDGDDLEAMAADARALTSADQGTVGGLRRFVADFETMFHGQWEDTKKLLASPEFLAVTHRGGTLLSPVSEDEAAESKFPVAWLNLVASYREFVLTMEERGVLPPYAPADASPRG